MNKTLKCKDILTVQEVAELLGLRYETIIRYINHNKLVATKLGRVWRVRKSDLNRFLLARENVRTNPSHDCDSHKVVKMATIRNEDIDINVVE
ncbi:helix-turn-helix domain-containing protein [Clostridium sp.]|uniref:helix-turn-helix domain-containing protein n=1 Tax=Clostridium sp. TaxID=1506 RepID=UPI002FC648BF